ncbi:ATP-binding protein (plasmid) [Streptomyces sp. BI20]|uniref:ATP-binding protein n=1 Tax=Streptomyces sp. BI20 TaxID=3403460 RepID=UPI003C716E1F
MRRKIAALAAATACCVAFAVGLIVHVWTDANIRWQSEAQVFNRLHTSMDVYKRTGTLSDDGTLDPPDLPGKLADPRDDERHTAFVEGSVGPEVWAAQRVDGPGSPILAVSLNMGPRYHDLRRLDITVAVASLLSLAVLLPLAGYGAGLLGRRLGRVSETAHRIADGDLDARTGTVPGGDEVSDIAAVVDMMADTLARRLRDERRFTADVAHELRTPVGGLLAAMDLLPPGETEDLLRARVRDLRSLVEDLLEVSRLDAGAEHAVRDRVPLLDVVAEAVARTGLDAEVTAAPGTAADASVETDPRRLERVVSNLVVNAHRHGAGPVEITVAVDPGPGGDPGAGARITVRDHGPGFPGVILRDGPRRFHTGAAERGTGHGLGLTIALAQARVLAAELTLANAPDGGAVATLHLPA